MGCAQSKRVEATVIAADVYRPPPTSVSLFDISRIEEPWVVKGETESEAEERPAEEKANIHVPALILEKLNKFEIEPNGPHSWSEVSKALEDLKPSLHSQKTSNLSKPAASIPKPLQDSEEAIENKPRPPRKSQSFHTLAELDKKLSSNSPDSKKTRFPELRRTQSKKTESKLSVVGTSDPDTVAYRPVKENLFVLRDRLERERSGAGNFDTAAYRLALKIRRDPLKEYPEKCPPGGMDKVILYTTSLRGVRRTFEDCNRLRFVVEGHLVAFDERDISLHGEFLTELRELLGEEVSVPRLFVKGRYIGGVDEVVELNESSRLGVLLNSVGIQRGLGSAVCEGCGGVRFIPCLECGGSCKVVVGDKRERCGACNENGLVQCPICH